MCVVLVKVLLQLPARSGGLGRRGWGNRHLQRYWMIIQGGEGAGAEWYLVAGAHTRQLAQDETHHFAVTYGALHMSHVNLPANNSSKGD